MRLTFIRGLYQFIRAERQIRVIRQEATLLFETLRERLRSAQEGKRQGLYRLRLNPSVVL